MNFSLTQRRKDAKVRVLKVQFGNFIPQFSNADYTKLRNLLVAQNWKEADQETYNVMIKAVGKEYGDWFTSDELLNFPHPDLSIIDLVKEEYNTI
jgi:hypothetical protein